MDHVDSPLSAELEKHGEVILDAAFAVHRAFGPGCLESLYRAALRHALETRGLEVMEEVWLDVEFEGKVFERALRADLVVERSVVVELKSADAIHGSHVRQLLTYLRTSGAQLGYLLNFGAPMMRAGIKRFVNTPVVVRRDVASS